MASSDRETDRVIGENVKALRGAMPQESLAQAMRDRGHAWSQSTVWSVETGSRPVRLAEAQVLAVILGVPIEQLVTTPDRLSWIRAVEQDTDKLVDAFNDLRQGATRLPRLAAELERLAGEFDAETDGERATVDAAHEICGEAFEVSKHLGAVTDAINRLGGMADG